MEPDTKSINSAPLSPEPRMGKFAASRLIAKESWAIVQQDKELLWFPVLSMLATLGVGVLVAALVFFGAMHGNAERLHDVVVNSEGSLGYYAVVFLYYLATFFIVNFFQAGMLVIANARFSGQNIGFADGMREARKMSGKLFLWSLVSSTIGVLLRMVADKFKLVGRIVASVFGAAWNILTFFSLPALVVGKKSIRESFTESAAIIRHTWGETIILNFGLGIFFGVISLIVMAVGGVIIFLLPTPAVMLAVLVLFIISLIAIGIVSSTLGTIFKLALYHYAKTGRVPPEYTPELVAHAIKAK